jgi:hypothetical protein
MTHLKSDKPQTKLGILNMAVEVIMQLEQQVRGTATHNCHVRLHVHMFSSLLAFFLLVSAKTKTKNKSRKFGFFDDDCGFFMVRSIQTTELSRLT